MRIKANYALRQVADTWCVLPLAEATLDLNGMLTLNESGVFLWNIIEKGCTEEELLNALTHEYDVTKEQAVIDIKEFVDNLRKANCLEE